MNKQSKYNYFVPYKYKVIYYNGMTRNSILLSQQEHTKIQEQFADPISFELGFPTVFEQFKDWGFFVDEAIDELDMFRYRENLNKWQNRNFHLVVVTNFDTNLGFPYYIEPLNRNRMPDFLTVLKKHIQQMINCEKISSICIEWTGGESLLNFDDFIEPVVKYTRKSCLKAGVPFHCQIETNGTLLNNHIIEKCKALDIACFKIKLIGNEAKHDKVLHEKGLPTFRLICNNIKQLCLQIPTCFVFLTFESSINKYDSELKQLASFFPLKIRNQIRINLQISTIDTLENAIQKTINFKYKLIEKALGFNQNMVDNEQNWKELIYHRDFQHTLIFNGEVHSGTTTITSSKDSIGTMLSEKGEIKWDIQKRSKLLGSRWYENEWCLNCNYLPLLSEICHRRSLPFGGTKHSIERTCILKTKQFSVDSIVVADYQAKELKVL